MTMELEDQSLKALASFLGGYFGGLTSTLIGSPLDTIKVRLQVQPSANPLYSGLFDCAKKIARQEGIFAFYRGAIIPVLTAGCISSLSVGLSYYYRDTFAKLEKSEESRFIHAFLGGGLAGASISLMGTPFDHVRIRMQVQSKINKAKGGPLACLKHIATKHGIKGIYSGFSATTLRNAMGGAWSFAAYEDIKKNIFKSDQGGILQPIISGSLAGTLARVTSYPFDSIKSRIQVDNLENPTYKSLYDCYSKIVKTEGHRALFRGLTPTLVQGMPTSAGFWTTYELVRTFINKNKKLSF